MKKLTMELQKKQSEILTSTSSDECKCKNTDSTPFREFDIYKIFYDLSKFETSTKY